MRPIARVVACAFACVVASGGTAGAGATRYAPEAFEAPTLGREAILAAVARATGAGDAAYAQRTERLTLRVGARSLAATLVVRGADFRITTTIDGESYASGRAAGVRWRRTPAGVVHVVSADTQGDDLDRWPLALFAFDGGAAEIAGSVRGPIPANVVAVRSQADSPRWFYVDMQTGDIVREVVREGSRTVVTRFDDFRTVGAVRRAFGWHLSGAGGDADVRVNDVREGPIDPADVALPATVPHTFVAASDARDRGLPASFLGRRIELDARVDGRPARLLLDTGTPQIVLDTSFVRGLHRTPILAHVTVDAIDVGALAARHVATTALPLGGNGIDGILGYDFFLGNVVHVDYRDRRVDWAPREAFVPGFTMHELDAPAHEGMPLVAIGLRDTIANRFVLDTGSSDIVLLRHLLESVAGEEDLGIAREAGPLAELPYLEGAIAARLQTVRSMRLANVDFRDVPARVEVLDRADAPEFPIDGILGTELLGAYEWWFDESGGRAWFR